MAGRDRKKELNEKKRKFLGILLILFSTLFFLSLVTHSGWDDRMIRTQDNPFTIDFRNQVGTVGALSSYLFFFFFGWLSIFLPFTLALLALSYLKLGWRSKVSPAVWFALFVSIMITMMTNIYKIEQLEYTIGYVGANGGYIFYHLTKFLIRIIGETGSVLLLGVGVIVELVALGYAYPRLRSRMKLPIHYNLGTVGRFFKGILIRLKGFIFALFGRKRAVLVEGEEPQEQYEKRREEGGARSTFDLVSGGEKTDRVHRSRKLELKKSATGIGRETVDFVFPGLGLLVDNPESGSAVNPDELVRTARALKDTLETFGVSIDGQIEKYPGPVITRFEFKPAAGIKVNQITNLSDDLALALQAKRIRIIAPIPGKAAVGVEIPNRKARLVYIKEIINSDAYSDNRVRLPLALGKTISGKPFVANLAGMPHLLIAGATGSGKSVCINSLITSLMYRLHPRELKFIFIDPKMLELSVYSGIPYLTRPVVTNAKRAEKVLSDAVVEMENRYQKLAGESVRDIDDYNARQKNVKDRMPYIVIIVDELADMMMASSSARIEMLITRLAQMARAVGIHLILATQRPSVDVITGLIKANFSSRIAFQVATKIDSRTILDGNGAEKLLGNGDMLFLRPGQPEPIRLHGAYISSNETRQLVKFITDQSPPEKESEGPSEDVQNDETDDVDLADPLFIEAAQTVVRHKQGSVSLLQRKLGVGYQRAARLIDRLEEAGIVSAYDGSKAREVLVDNSYLEKLLTTRSLIDPNS